VFVNSNKYLQSFKSQKSVQKSGLKSLRCRT